MSNGKQPSTDSQTDTEGHMPYSIKVEPAGEECDDTEGQRFVPAEERPLVGDTPGAKTGNDDDPDDTEGHRAYARNVGASFDEESADAPEEASSGESGDTPSSGDDPDDTDGHRLYARNVGAGFDGDSAESAPDIASAESDGGSSGNADDSDDPDDAEGHKMYRNHVGVVFG